MLERMVAATQDCEILRHRRPAVLPGNGVVEVGVPGVLVAGGELAMPIASLEVAPKARRDPVEVSRNDHFGHRIGEDPEEFRGI